MTLRQIHSSNIRDFLGPDVIIDEIELRKSPDNIMLLAKTRKPARVYVSMMPDHTAWICGEEECVSLYTLIKIPAGTIYYRKGTSYELIPYGSAVISSERRQTAKKGLL